MESIADNVLSRIGCTPFIRTLHSVAFSPRLHFLSTTFLS